MHKELRAWIFLFLFLGIGCVSKSLLEDRFSASSALSAPTVTVNLNDPDHYTFAIVGDLHVGGTDTTRFRTILSQATAEGDAFIILLGDIVDKGERDSVVAVQTAISDLGWTNRVLPIIGNHDIFGDGWLAYRDLEGPTHYTETIGNARFIALDTADGNVGKDQADWLAQELDKPRPTHTFILSHYMPVVPNQRTYLRLSDEDEAIRLMKLAASRRVTAWLGGHYHSYLNANIAGVDYVVAGGGGGRRMDPFPVFFFVEVTVNGAQVSYQMHQIN